MNCSSTNSAIAATSQSGASEGPATTTVTMEHLIAATAQDSFAVWDSSRRQFNCARPRTIAVVSQEQSETDSIIANRHSVESYADVSTKLAASQQSTSCGVKTAKRQVVGNRQDVEVTTRRQLRRRVLWSRDHRDNRSTSAVPGARTLQVLVNLLRHLAVIWDR